MSVAVCHRHIHLFSRFSSSGIDGVSFCEALFSVRKLYLSVVFFFWEFRVLVAWMKSQTKEEESNRSTHEETNNRTSLKDTSAYIFLPQQHTRELYRQNQALLLFLSKFQKEVGTYIWVTGASAAELEPPPRSERKRALTTTSRKCPKQAEEEINKEQNEVNPQRMRRI